MGSALTSRPSASSRQRGSPLRNHRALQPQRPLGGQRFTAGTARLFRRHRGITEQQARPRGVPLPPRSAHSGSGPRDGGGRQRRAEPAPCRGHRRRARPRGRGRRGRAGRGAGRRALTGVEHLEGGEGGVLQRQVLRGGAGAVVLDEGEAAGAQDVVVGAVHAPVEVREAELVVAHRAVLNAVRRPVGQAALPQVLAQHLRGVGAGRRRSPPQQQPQDRLVQPPQRLHPTGRPAPSGGHGRCACARRPRFPRMCRRRAALRLWAGKGAEGRRGAALWGEVRGPRRTVVRTAGVWTASRSAWGNLYGTATDFSF